MQATEVRLFVRTALGADHEQVVVWFLMRRFSSESTVAGSGVRGLAGSKRLALRGNEPPRWCLLPLPTTSLPNPRAREIL
jgi:hypothetical protein